ncbi:DUF1961 family protein [Thalassotalea euphylliae]|uniref:DUF1961 family protein n=1 Tax=Thalassotalea euphylliae TaxID=1655234 RepID=A0A3E0U1B1_9GAMM|nr:DUF1961 family protein [Thalassotalea euphylliae]REL30736.1 DUF1961 family protein [Thalassotalea euphylliae]
MMRNKLMILLCLLSMHAAAQPSSVGQKSLVAGQSLPIDQPLPVLLQGDYRSDELHQVLGSQRIYQADFSSKESLAKEWQVEGPAKLTLNKARQLIFESQFTADFIQAYLQGLFDFVPNQLGQYYQVLAKLAQATLPTAQYQSMLDAQQRFKGGHVVLWNKQQLPDSYIVEFDLQHQSPMGLFILFFSASGLNNESIFSPTLAKRNGVFKQYTSGDIQSYHVSSYTPHRSTANLRKNYHGGRLLKSQPDMAALAPDKVYKYRLIKWRDRFQLYLNDQLQMDYVDKENALQGGHVGLRLMASARAMFSDFNLYQLQQNPFALPASKQQMTVSNSEQLIEALATLTPGTTIWLESGKYPDVAAELSTSGTLTERIYINAKQPGQVLFTGKPAIKITGSHITLSGIRFTDGDRFDNSAYVKSKGNKITKKAPYILDLQGSYIRISNCSIDFFDGHHATWFNIEGSKNRVDHCTFVNKQTHGGVLSNAKPPASGAFHRFDHNYFSRPDIGSDNAEVIRLATGWSHNIDAYMTVEYNVFEQCNGEGEVISDKSSRNTIRLNRFTNNLGGLSLRQGNYSHVYGNWFERQQSPRKGNTKESSKHKRKKRARDFGVMIRGKHHLIENNHFQGGGPNLIKLVNGQPEGYQKPGRPKALPRHHIAAEQVVLRHNNFIPTNVLAEIDKRKFNKDRSVLAHDISFIANLIYGQPGWQLLSTISYAGVSWQGNGVVAQQSPVVDLDKGTNEYFKRQAGLPNAYQQRFGSQPLTDYMQPHRAGASWQDYPLAPH